MLPIRRQRLLTFCAVIIVFLLYRVVQNSWDDANYSGLRAVYETGREKLEDIDPADQDDSTPPVEHVKPNPAVQEEAKLPAHMDENDKADYVDSHNEYADQHGEVVEDVSVEIPDLDDKGASSGDQAKQDKLSEQEIEASEEVVQGNGQDLTGANKVLQGSHDEEGADLKATPSKTAPNDTKGSEPEVELAHPPGVAQVKAEDIPEFKRVYWEKQPEHFPVPSESITPLPSGAPKKIPQIQYDFQPESEEQKSTRVKRQQRVKEEIARSWGAYAKYAWMHDELSPVSGKYRDPFCGWAATLVDSLDTLWIAGLKKEFDEAVKAVADIDFTWTPKNDIPVFETTIRYLGGLLAAYDVSGGAEGNHKILLDKAVELGEILFGVFDTPNRMPLLYYQWKPEDVAQPRRASTRSGIAELGTLSMEFTRLAQLTKEDKYYDAIDRITNGLVQLSKDGVLIPGLFPENIDLSGCNRTATTLRDEISKAAQAQLATDDAAKDPAGYVPGEKEGVNQELARNSVVVAKRDEQSRTATDDEIKRGNPPFKADGTTAEWDCVPQGLVPSGYSIQTFHMGGGQDSAYEYFPKEYLLLGGLEDKYQKLYEDAVTATNEWLMFRPMAPDDWDVLFPAKVTLSPDTDIRAQFEIAHLTCFIGGMYGLGGKIFEREADVEKAKQLTDGCVWAYQLFPSGLMPESANVIPCDSLDKCEFNETQWWDILDPSRVWREEELLRWEGESKEKAEEAAHLKALAEQGAPESASYKVDSKEEAEVARLKEAAELEDSKPIEKAEKESFNALNDEQAKLLEQAAQEHTEDEDSYRGAPLKKRDPTPPPPDESDVPASKTVPKDSAPHHETERKKPLTHKEHVQKRIKSEGFPPGFVSINARNYILRPEAIESVWYMYRITGDPTWMDKGWTMFEATLTATRTTMANSAVGDVTAASPELLDAMESFWIAETLKYYYLLFSEPDVISLDEWVLNTEAHPFKRPT
ncbi:class I alpha-mannosidase 1A [Emericellopsis atlantica]|uniref:alpha-1,2-Mannosidase n=1 Tax=Emericellopsis atlantica TaxID=2614577 RepID=A0A9P7ZF61_9HYPO|nr:class I alpha-mannosidase 1A [Emericellopsis atlantica]KAG9250532.1 class I alpha-mannosidase 1A [Emericellopsis atlantica]